MYILYRQYTKMYIHIPHIQIIDIYISLYIYIYIIYIYIYIYSCVYICSVYMLNSVYIKIYRPFNIYTEQYISHVITEVPFI